MPRAPSCSGRRTTRIDDAGSVDRVAHRLSMCCVSVHRRSVDVKNFSRGSFVAARCSIRMEKGGTRPKHTGPQIAFSDRYATHHHHHQNRSFRVRCMCQFSNFSSSRLLTSALALNNSIASVGRAAADTDSVQVTFTTHGTYTCTHRSLILLCCMSTCQNFSSSRTEALAFA